MNNLVLITDNNYCLPTIVAVQSFVKNADKQKMWCVNILCDNVKEENKKMFSVMKSENVEIKLIDVDSSSYNGLEKSYSKVSKASLLKFSIADLLPNIETVLYIDGDVIVRKDISDIFEINLKDNYAAVIKDGPKDKVPGGKEHSFYGESGYFNSGVMYLNLRKMREDNIPKKLIDYRLNGYNYFMDQDTFNVVFNGNVIYLSVIYDFMLHLISYRNESFSLKQLIDFYELEEYLTIDALFNDVKIFHYTFDKPWKYFDVPFNEIWMDYYYSSPLKAHSLNRKSYTTVMYNAKSHIWGRKIASLFKLFIKPKS